MASRLTQERRHQKYERKRSRNCANKKDGVLGENERPEAVDTEASI
jgi:hypothetical protein